MTITFPSTATIKDSIRDTIGESVTFVVTTSGTPCSICAASGWYDSRNHVSLNVFCPVCSGAYYINTESSVAVTAHVRWSSMDQPEFGPAGQTFEGDCSVTISIDDLTTTQVNTVKHIIVDSRKVQPFRTIYRGVPTRDRIRFMCRESEKV